MSFEGEANRIDEDAKGVINVGETGDMEPGAVMLLTIDLSAGHYGVVCNLPGHYAMGMHQDFFATDGPPVTVALGETDPQTMYIHMSSSVAPAGEVAFVVTNEGAETHEFVVLSTDTPAADLPIVSFEGEANRIDEEAKGVVNVGETGDMEPGTSMVLTIDLSEGHYAVVCNLPGHYANGMHRDFSVVPAGSVPVTVALGETDSQHMYIHMSQAVAPQGKVSFVVTNEGTETHEFVVLSTGHARGRPTDRVLRGRAEPDRRGRQGRHERRGDRRYGVEPGTSMVLTIDLSARATTPWSATCPATTRWACTRTCRSRPPTRPRSS